MLSDSQYLEGSVVYMALKIFQHPVYHSSGCEVNGVAVPDGYQWTQDCTIVNCTAGSVSTLTHLNICKNPPTHSAFFPEDMSCGDRVAKHFFVLREIDCVCVCYTELEFDI